jgi:ParB family chromosome partitioning protein
VEEARSVAVLCEQHGLTKAEVARRVGHTREAISNLVRLLELPDEALELIDSGTLTEGHGRALLLCPDQGRRRLLARRAAMSGWSVRRPEAETRGGPGTVGAGPLGGWHPDQLEFAERLGDALSRALGRDVVASPSRNGYEVLLRVSDLADAADLLDRLGAGDDLGG